MRKQEKKRVWKAVRALLLSAVLALSAPVSYLSADSEVDATQADENGFVIKDGVLTAYNGTATEVVIPEGVTIIGKDAFFSCSALESIEIPEGVTSIGDRAFFGCSALESIVIPEGMTSIGDWVFCGCSALESIVISEGVTSIGLSAFEGCSALESIEIPSSVTSIWYGAFSGCSGLKSIEIPSSVTYIGDRAFSGCSALESIEIPSSATSIGSGAFSGCSSLESIVVEEGNTVYDSRGNCNAIIKTESNNLIAGCSKTVIPSSVTSIGDRAFSGCSGLKSIEIPSSVTYIGDRAFSGCSALESIEIPSSATSIGSGAFSSCSGLESIVVEKGNTVYDSRGNCNAIIETESNNLIAGCSKTVIPSSITSIETGAFGDCSGLKSIEIPLSVTSIGRFAFSGCSGLESIVIEEGNTIYDSRGNCNAIIETESNNLIAGCRKTVIPSSVTSIETGAFSGCSRLKSIVIPPSVTSIRTGAFFGCSGLESVVISEGVTSIEEAFSDCRALKSIVIPSSVTSIDRYAFEDCDKLIIYGEEGSYAQKYAEIYWIPFRLIGEWNELKIVDNILTSEEMTQLIGENKTKDTVFQIEDGLIFTFKKGTMELVEGVDSYDFGAEITEDCASLPNGDLTEEEFAFRINFNYSGQLPGEAEITILADSKWAGQRLYYYEINEDGSYSYVCRSTVAEDGSYTVKQSHCSSYVATTKVPENLGDCDGEKGVTSKDALAILKYDVGISQENFVVELADCDGEDGITANDALAILKHDVGLQEKFY